MAKASQLTYTYALPKKELFPLNEFQQMFEKEDLLALFAKSLLVESLMRRADADIMAEEKAKAPEAEGTKKVSKPGEGETETKTFVISYFNPELDRTEVLTSTSQITIKDQVQLQIEEAIGRKSAFGIYSFVATPLVMQKVDPYLLEDILKNREYETPPPFGAAPIAAKPRAAQIVVVVEDREKAKEALVESIDRKERVEAAIGKELVVLEEAVKGLRGERPIDKVLAKLPPLTRARFEIAMRKKKLSAQLIARLLKRDIGFLKEVKNKLEAMSADDLLGLVKAIKGLMQG